MVATGINSLKLRGGAGLLLQGIEVGKERSHTEKDQHHIRSRETRQSERVPRGLHATHKTSSDLLGDGEIAEYREVRCERHAPNTLDRILSRSG